MTVKKVLVTGSNGYIGSHLIKKFLDEGIEVLAVDQANSRVDPRATYIQRNIFSGIDDLLDNVDVVVHLAWKNGFDHNDIAHIESLSNHVRLIEEVVAFGVPKLAVMGTMHEVGYWEGPISASTPCFPQSFYGIAKDALRNSATTLCRNSKTKLLWLRGFYLVGDNAGSQSIFSKIEKSETSGKTTFPFNSGANKYDFLNIDEAVVQIFQTINQDDYCGIINICSGVPISLGEYVESYIRNRGYKIKLDYGKYPDRPYDSPIIYGDNSIIQSIMAS